MAWLVCTKGDDKGLQMELADKPVTMGRAPDCDMQVVESRASRYHCRLVFHNDRLFVEDLDSTNGIKYKGKRYQQKKLRLKLGESFAIGNDIFTFSRSQDMYVEASEDVLSKMNKQSRDGMVEHTIKDALSEELHRKKRGAFGLFSFLFGRGKK